MKYIDSYILKEFNNCKKFLRDKQDIFVTKADKGQITVVMEKTDYNNRMTDLLNDESTYRKLKKDPISQLTTKLNKLVKSWYDSDIIDDPTYYRLKCTNGNLPRCYGLPKFYEQIFGSPMGSPLSPKTSDIVMEDLEMHCLGALDFEIKIFYRYVDDIFTIIPRSKLNDVLNAFNSYHPRLNFTFELESNNSLPFLDTIVIRD
ncbi:uncharacterized protein LOC112460135, partial [Temnothorax curvispinosus]|uniref:Uncharacterized protein LOC112460135 n=1 Tax=Temnothorax curvispinosus TaxID=300111 RepID=A0A6J1QDR1_9HYME